MNKNYVMNNQELYLHEMTNANSIYENLSMNTNNFNRNVSQHPKSVCNADINGGKRAESRDKLLEMKYKNLLAEAEKVSKELNFIRDKKIDKIAINQKYESYSQK